MLLVEMLDNPGLAVFLKDERGVYISINECGARMLGVQRNDVPKHSDFELFDAASAMRIRERDQRILSGKVPWLFESQAENNLGFRKYKSLKIPMLNPQRQPTGLLGISADVTIWRNKAQFEILRELYMYCLRSPKRATSLLEHCLR